MSLCDRKPTIWIPTRSDTNWTVQSQKMVSDWKFWKVQELYYPCSFRLCRLLVFPCGGPNIIRIIISLIIPFILGPTKRMDRYFTKPLWHLGVFEIPIKGFLSSNFANCKSCLSYQP